MNREDRSGTRTAGDAAGERPVDAHALQARRDALDDILRSCGSICIGYSGGVDSAFLAVAATRALGADRVLAVTGVSASVALAQIEAARRIARDHGVPHLEVRTDELSDPSYSANPTNRCYYCKTELWSKLSVVARERGLEVLADGTNADDAGDHRHGMRAGLEHAVRSPLLEAGLAKADIRALSRVLGLETWDAPAAPCLASRLPHGLAVTAERLRQVETTEAAVAALGFREFRVRHHGDVARLEFAAAELPRAIERAHPILGAARAAGFDRAGIDVGGYRRGALHEAGLVRIGAGRVDRADRAHSLLVEHGVAFEAAAAAGSGADVLWVRTSTSAIEPLLRTAAALRSAGFRWVALEPVASPHGRRSA